MDEAARYTGHQEAERIAADSGLPYTWDETPKPANYGGRLVVAKLNCTGGFVVNDGTATSPNRKVSTASHCVDIGQAGIQYGPADGFFATDYTFDEFHDYAFLDKAGVSWSNKVKFVSTGETRDVQSNQSWASMDVGDPVAKYGETTGYSSGTIVDKHSCGGTYCDPEAIWVRVDANSAYTQMCTAGDSGGPNMWLNRAYGISTNYYGDGDCVYMPVQLMGNAVTGDTSHE